MLVENLSAKSAQLYPRSMAQPLNIVSFGPRPPVGNLPPTGVLDVSEKMTFTSASLLKVPPEMIAELAYGFEEPHVVGQRYGYSKDDILQLYKQGWFTKAIQSRRDRLEKEGDIFRAKMQMLAEELILEVWESAMQSDSCSLKLDVAKFLTKIADMEPKNNQQIIGTGSGYQIIIQIPDNYKPVEDTHRSVEPSQSADSPPVIDITPNKPDELPGPKPFIIPDFDLTNDLTNYPQTPGGEGV